MEQYKCPVHQAVSLVFPSVNLYGCVYFFDEKICSVEANSSSQQPSRKLIMKYIEILSVSNYQNVATMMRVYEK